MPQAALALGYFWSQEHVFFSGEPGGDRKWPLRHSGQLVGDTGVILIRDQSKWVKVETQTSTSKMEDSTFLLKQSEKRSSIQKNGFLDTGLQAVKDSNPWEMKNRKGEPTFASVYYLERVSRWCHREKELRGPSRFPESLGERRWVDATEECQRGERIAEICWRSPWTFSWMF